MALAIETISSNVAISRLLTDAEYSRVHDPQFCSENNKPVVSFPVTLYLKGSFTVALSRALIWLPISMSPL